MVQTNTIGQRADSLISETSIGIRGFGENATPLGLEGESEAGFADLQCGAGGS